MLHAIQVSFVRSKTCNRGGDHPSPLAQAMTLSMITPLPLRFPMRKILNTKPGSLSNPQIEVHFSEVGGVLFSRVQLGVGMSTLLFLFSLSRVVCSFCVFQFFTFFFF
jgi:hypothetical protein